MQLVSDDQVTEMQLQVEQHVAAQLVLGPALVHAVHSFDDQGLDLRPELLATTDEIDYLVLLA